MSYPQFRNEKKPRSSLLIYAAIVIISLAFIAILFAMLSINLPLMEKCVAIVEITDEISTSGTPVSLFSEGTAGSEDIAKKIDSLNSRNDIASVLFVINSPGGSVVATREIYDSVKGLKKPKVAYLRETAASGAYYIATATDYIISDPDALTGSIGVIATFADMSVLFDKIGVNTTNIKSGESKDIGSPVRPMTDKERAIIQAIVNEIFTEFKNVVIANRGSALNRLKFEEILDGRVVTGRQAKDIGLVDQLGSKKDALKKAAELGNITAKEPLICKITIKRGTDDIFSMQSLLAGLLHMEKGSTLSLSYR